MIIYLVGINLISFIIMIVDKIKAIKKRSRISEKSLFILSLFGGSIGVLVGMYTIRHKTKKIKFYIGIPLILIIQIILIYVIISMIN